MNINLLTIVSALHNEQKINKETQQLINDIEAQSDYQFTLTDVNHFYDETLSLILVQSGGSEGAFLKIYDQLKEPFYLLTYGSNNSLAASMEILSFLRDNHKAAEILHGSEKYIIKRLDEITKKSELPAINLGVVGKPSDWLIASNVNYDLAKKIYNVQLIDIDINELIDTYEEIELGDFAKDIKLPFNEKEVEKAKRLSKAFELIKQKYQLEGLTVRCFDLLDRIHTTGCIGLSLLNMNDSIGTCEGDIPAMLSMYILKQVTGQPGFQANPSSIDVENNEMIFAHCTLPFDMSQSYKVMTHYESGIGVALRGKLKKTEITIFKLSRNLKDYYVSEGYIIDNLNEDNLCRTQIKIHIDDIEYFLTAPYGNHHLIVYGHHREKIKRYLEQV